MGDMATLAKARQELEDLYLGVPDESVNLTFKDFASIELNGVAEKKIIKLEPVNESRSMNKKEELPLDKSPSLDFSKGLENLKHHKKIEAEIYQDHTNNSTRNKGLRNAVESSLVYDDRSVMSTRSRIQDTGGRRRPGIPHSNICTVCSDYIYIFRNRCLVCGRVYCRQCLSIGMGEMTEGRKCIECLGRRFSQRYIKRAGSFGCCARIPSRVKQQELKWAEKGPRRNGERKYGRSSMVSRSVSPVMPRSPVGVHASMSPSSFVMSSPYSPTNPPMPY
ncbi:uncharacterized protein LOC143847782 [Tasmannia lanceolata]|uniref:uncharacterized protein LOC143847782 n=1 Tax=Tasmannia lanceolata TaxID=3420 RepID=UPI00406281AB